MSAEGNRAAEAIRRAMARVKPRYVGKYATTELLKEMKEEMKREVLYELSQDQNLAEVYDTRALSLLAHTIPELLYFTLGISPKESKDLPS